MQQVDTLSILEQIKQKYKPEFVNFKFVNLLGGIHQFTIPAHEFTESAVEKGIPYDGSSIIGFQNIDQSDMRLVPDLKTAARDLYSDASTIDVLCSVTDPRKEAPYDHDPITIAQRAEEFLKTTNIGTTAYFGGEVEFFILDGIAIDNDPHHTSFRIESEEGPWNKGDANGKGTHIGLKGGYFRTQPHDRHHNLRNKMVSALETVGIHVERHHHEVGTAGQAEINIRYGTLVEHANHITMLMHIIQNEAHRAGRIVTRMPKPLFGDNGSGMHTHQSIWNNDTNLFYKEGGLIELSDVALHYIGGLFEHMDALMAFCAPTTNSYRRLVPGYEAPNLVGYGLDNRSLAIRIPNTKNDSAGARLEFRAPDPMANPFLAFSAMLMAGIEGIQRKLQPGEPFEGNAYDGNNNLKPLPGSLEESLTALEKDHEFLLKDGVFTDSVIGEWINLKRKEIAGLRARPHPYEFEMYF
jgi:glutamine synthetase